MAVNKTRRPRVVMMCGPGGAGKTTYAKRMEHEGWTRLSFEVEFWDRGITTMPSAKVVAEVAADLKARLLSHVAAGNDVVLDFGFWFRRQRDEFRALLAPQSIVPETVYIATSLATILSRVGGRHGRRA
ncbi:MAG: AAA family ATPase, partial [Pseudoclavibacter sp.]